MASAFDGMKPETVEFIRKRLLAGDRMHTIRSHFEFIGLDGKSTISARQMRKMRDEVFGPLVSDPEAVKALANGPLLNSNAIIKYSHSIRAIKRALAEQTEMFPA